MKIRCQVLCVLLCMATSSLAFANSVLSAYGTSYSSQSSYVTKLINKNYTTIDADIFWEPKSKDNGLNEGLYIQFEKPITVDEVNFFINDIGGQVTVYYDGVVGDYRSWNRRVTELQKKDHPFNRALSELSLKDSKKEYYRQSIVAAKVPTSKDLKDDIYTRLAELSNVVGHPLFSKESKYTFKSIFIKLNHKIPVIGRIYAIEFKNNGQVVPIQIPVSVPIKASASSTLSPQPSYDISNIADSQLSMAWSTDGAQSIGVGESFQFEFDADAIPTINGVLIWNGYQRSDSHFNANGRVQNLTINGEAMTLRDRLGAQEFIFAEPKQSQQLTFTIESIYPGTKYKDVLISELRLIGTDNRILPIIKKPKVKIHTGLEKVVDQAFSSLGMVNQQRFPVSSDELSYIKDQPGLAEQLGTAEQVYLNNTHFYSDFKVDDTYVRTDYSSRDCYVNYSSLKIRSNGTFVLYDRLDKEVNILQIGDEMDQCAAYYSATIMEGNWESLSKEEIRLFGKKYDTEVHLKNSGNYSYIYRGTGLKKEKPRIFQSYVTVNSYNDLSETEQKNAIALLYQSSPEIPYFYAHISYQVTPGLLFPLNISGCQTNVSIDTHIKEFACENTGVHFFSASKEGLYQKLDGFFERVNPIYFKSKEFTTLFFPANNISEYFTFAFVK